MSVQCIFPEKILSFRPVFLIKFFSLLCIKDFLFLPKKKDG